MSDLRPVGTSVNFDGVEREFLFTFNVLDELEDYFGKPILETLKDITNLEDRKTMRKVVQVLVNDDVERYNLIHPDKREKVSEQYVGMFLTRDLHGGNSIDMMGKIVEAYHISFPDVDEDSPKVESGQQKT